jgi:hypothetical protein
MDQDKYIKNNFMDENTPIQQKKIKKELEDLSKEMKGATYKIINN